jgi:hypothetical protein
MKSLILFGYLQPVNGSSFRFGVLEKTRDTKKDPLQSFEYRKYDKDFDRSRHIETLSTFGGVKTFYRERISWRVVIPYVGSLLRIFMPK